MSESKHTPLVERWLPDAAFICAWKGGHRRYLEPNFIECNNCEVAAKFLEKAYQRGRIAAATEEMVKMREAIGEVKALAGRDPAKVKAQLEAHERLVEAVERRREMQIAVRERQGQPKDIVAALDALGVETEALAASRAALGKS